MKATMKLRWINSEDEDVHDSRNAVSFYYNHGWGWPSSVVLQQLWIDDEGEEYWMDVELYNAPD